MSIPEDWSYQNVRSHKVLGFWPVYKRLPVAWIVEGTSTLQCLCPYCEYGEGYNGTFIAGRSPPTELHCDTCGTDFWGMTV